MRTFSAAPRRPAQARAPPVRASLRALGLPFCAASTAARITTRQASAVCTGTCVALDMARVMAFLRCAFSSSVALGRRYAAITAS